MMSDWKVTVQAGAVVLMLAVLLGAFGSHALAGVLDSDGRELWEKANFYHFVHGIALLCLGCCAHSAEAQYQRLRLAGLAFVLGIFCFSGSLYLYAWLRTTWLVMFTPLGGLMFVSGWGLFVLAMRTPDRLRIK